MMKVYYKKYPYAYEYEIQIFLFPCVIYHKLEEIGITRDIGKIIKYIGQEYS